jgi:hypothetical protein
VARSGTAVLRRVFDMPCPYCRKRQERRNRTMSRPCLSSAIVPRHDGGTGDVFMFRLPAAPVLQQGNGKRAGKMPALQRRKLEVKGAGRRPAVRETSALLDAGRR